MVNTAVMAAVRRNFRYALAESRRVNSICRRVAYPGPCGPLRIWMPRTVPAAAGRAWIGKNVPDIDIGRPGEAKRIQAAFDRHWGEVTHVTFDFVDSAELADREASGIGRECRNMPAELRIGTIDAVITNIQRQRPSIRQLGPKIVRRLLGTLFDEWGGAGRSWAQLAASYGVDKSARSRFVGDVRAVVARIILTTPHFAELAREMGMDEQIAGYATLGRTPSGVGRRGPRRSLGHRQAVATRVQTDERACRRRASCARLRETWWVACAAFAQR